jgi:hypothetical protein
MGKNAFSETLRQRRQYKLPLHPGSKSIGPGAMCRIDLRAVMVVDLKELLPLRA